MSNPNSPKIALVTGGSRGLGRSAALHLARRGADVVLTYHTNKAAADDVVAEIAALGRKAVALPLDAGDVSSFDGFGAGFAAALRQTWGRETSTSSSTTPAWARTPHSARPAKRTLTP